MYPENLNVKDILDSVLSSIKAALDEKSMSIAVECDSTLQLYADSDKLKQILINIVDNAVKYTGHSGKIVIKVRNKLTKIEFRIKDTGIGISAEELLIIFDKFYRIDKSRQSSTGGTGLGLNITKSLIELHGGKIWVESELGAGTEVIFELPT